MNWYKIAQAQITYSHEMDDTCIHVHAFAMGKEVGNALFRFDPMKQGFMEEGIPTPEHLMWTDNVWVEEPYRRRGIATAMYTYAEKIVGTRKVSPGAGQTDDGIALWKQKNRPFGEPGAEEYM